MCFIYGPELKVAQFKNLYFLFWVQDFIWVLSQLSVVLPGILKECGEWMMCPFLVTDFCDLLKHKTSTITIFWWRHFELFMR